MPANTNRRFLDRDPLTGAVEYFHSNADGTEFVIERVEDVTPLIEHNKFLANEGRKGKDGWMVAQYPMTIYHELMQKGWLPHQDPKAYARWLNDPDQRVFRINKA